MGLENGYKFLIYTLLPPNWDISINGAQSGIFVQKIVSNRFTVTKSRSKRIRFFRLTNRKMIWQTEKRKKLDLKKWRKSGDFFLFWNFFKIIFNKSLDFWKKCAHTMRAFKLRRNQKRISTPEISAVNGTTDETGFLLNTQTLWIKAAHQKILILSKSVQEEICRQLNLELSKLWLSQCAYPRQVVGLHIKPR